MRNLFFVILAGTLALTACGDKKKDDTKGQAGDKGGAGDATAAAAAASELVPAELKGKLSFTTAKGEDDRFVAVVPEGWQESPNIPGRYKPADNSSMGFMSSFSVGANCDGSCEPKDWAATSDKIDFQQFTGGEQFTVEKDEKADGKRLLLAKTDDKVYLVVARWQQGASRYFVCHVTLDKEIAGASAAFEKACQGMAITSW